jgi:restriction modification system DNA specificity domain protein
MFGNPIINDKKYPVFKLKDISHKIGSGVTPRGGDSNYIDKGVAFIRSMNVYNNTFKKENLVYIDKSLAKQLSQVELFSNDLLLNITGASVARCCIVPDDILPARVNQHVCIIRQCRISNVFLEYCLTNESYQEYLLLLSNKNGATREALTKAQVENLEVIFPPLTEITRFVRIVHQINKLKFA